MMVGQNIVVPVESSFFATLATPVCSDSEPQFEKSVCEKEKTKTGIKSKNIDKVAKC